LTLSGTNTFSGPTTVDEGTLQLAGGNALANTMALSVNSNGALKLAASETIGSLSGAGAVNLQANTLTILSTSSGTYSGVISNLAGGKIIKSGDGLWTLDSTSSFNTGLTLSQGTLQVTNSLSLGGSGTLTTTGGTLTSSGTQAVTLANPLSFSGTLGLGDATNNGSLTLSGSAALASNFTLNVYNLANDTTIDDVREVFNSNYKLPDGSPSCALVRIAYDESKFLSAFIKQSKLIESFENAEAACCRSDSAKNRNALAKCRALMSKNSVCDHSPIPVQFKFSKP
jgi:autotransporter-associated beta strand protein